MCVHISFVISLFLKRLRVERANCSHDVPSLLNTPAGIFLQTGTLFYITANNLPHQEINIGTTLPPNLLSPFKFRPLSQQCLFSFLGQHAIQEYILHLVVYFQTPLICKSCQSFMALTVFLKGTGLTFYSMAYNRGPLFAGVPRNDALLFPVSLIRRHKM